MNIVWFWRCFVLFILLVISFTCNSNIKLKQSNIDVIKSNKEKLHFSYKVGNDTINKDLKILTWNIQNLGKTKNQDEILQIVKIINDFDVVAIQEVVGKDPKGAQAVAKIWDELNRKGAKWDYRISNPTKSPSANMSERYAYIWKTAKLSLINKSYLDTSLEDVLIREPFIAEFKSKKNTKSFFLINYHSRVHNQNPEKEIIYFKDYREKLKTENIIIAGDFNLNESHSVWDSLYTIGFKPSIQDSPTTLKRKCKKGNYLSHSIDNIYFNSKQFELINSGKIDFVRNCENLINARMISNHLPVFLEFKFY